ncbi:hypothetical protein G6F40_016801 [Rhizopus arrhizus]|nr:hypothetical protein G6F40_016801 [Rhizopus arrhizus]
MNLGLQQRSADGRVLRSYPLDAFRKAADSPIEQIRFDAHGKAWVMGGARGIQRADLRPGVGRPAAAVAGPAGRARPLPVGWHEPAPDPAR